MDMNLGIYLGRSNPYSLGIGFGHSSGDIMVPRQSPFKLSLKHVHAHHFILFYK